MDFLLRRLIWMEAINIILTISVLGRLLFIH